MKTTRPIKTSYNGTELFYENDQWVFTLRGRKRKVDTLTQAREAIDAPPPKDKKSFDRVRCYAKQRYGGDGFREIDVTSVAAPGRYSYGAREKEVWTQDTEGKNREKRSASDCFPVTPSQFRNR